MKAIKIVLIVLISIISATIITGITVGYFYGDSIQKIAINELNKNLKTKVNIENIDISFLENLPYVSIILDNVYVESVKGKSNYSFKDINTDTLLFAEKLSLNFNLFKAIKNDYDLNKVVIENGKLNIFIDKSGIDNYHLWNSKKQEKETQVNINLKEIILNNIYLKFNDKSNNTESYCHVNKLKLSGKFSSDSITSQANLDMKVLYLFNEKNKYISDLSINSKMNFSSNPEQFKIYSGSTNIKKQEFYFSGCYIFKEDRLKDVKINGNNHEIPVLATLIPEKFVLPEYKRIKEGKITYDILINDKTSNVKIPEIKISYEIKDVLIIGTKSEILFDNVFAKGNYWTGEQSNLESSIFSINKLKLNLPNAKTIEGSIEIANLKAPIINGKLSLDIDLEYLNRFDLLKNDKTITGEIIGNINFSGISTDYKTLSVSDLNWNGNLDISNLQILTSNNVSEYKIISVKVEPTGEDIVFTGLIAEYLGSNYVLNGNLTTPINSYLNNRPFIIKANIESDLLDFDKISSSNSEESSFSLESMVYLEADIKLKEFIYDRITATDISTRLIYKDKVIQLNDLIFNSINGSINSNIIISDDTNNTIRIKGKANLIEIDIHEFFYSFRNFNQTFLQAKNITGDLSGEVFFDTQWTPEFNFLEKNLVVESSVEVIDGELHDFKPMMELSDYLRVPDLKQIRFSNLRNDIVILDQTVNIPLMEINSSALNLNISGTHSFDQFISYDITLLLSEILSKRFKSKESEEWIEYDDEESQAKIYLKAEGHIDSFDIKYDFRKARDENKTKRKEEAKELKAVLHHELGLFKKDSVELQKIIEKKNTKQKKKVQIIWDEEEDIEVEDPNNR